MSILGRAKANADIKGNVQTIPGTFQCQTCARIVLEAYYLAEIQQLGYKCEKGHRSTIKDFGLDWTE